MDIQKELCWTCANLKASKCPIKVELNKANKYHSTKSIITECKKYIDVKK